MDSEKEKKLWVMVFNKNNSIYNNKDFNFIINKSLIQYERILKKINIIINNKNNNLKKSKKGKTSEKSRKSKKGKKK